MPSDATEINALLGGGTEFTGKLTFEGTVRIDGRFEGEVFTDGILIVGEGAEVRARIEVGTMIVKGGVVVGDIRARDLVEIHAPGRLLGNITSPSLYIGKGVVFDGHCQMGDGDREGAEAGIAQPQAAAEQHAPRFAPPPSPTAAPFAPGPPPPRPR